MWKHMERMREGSLTTGIYMSEKEKARKEWARGSIHEGERYALDRKKWRDWLTQVLLPWSLFCSLKR